MFNYILMHYFTQSTCVEFPNKIYKAWLDLIQTMSIFFMQVCPKYYMGHTYAKNVFVFYLNPKFNWASVFGKSANPMTS